MIPDFHTSSPQGKQFFEKMLLIRRCEEKLLELFAQGKLNGTTHTSIGQESCSVGVISALNLEIDVIFSNHRCHGHYIAYGAPLELLFAEVMGKYRGANHGIGGSQHLQTHNFYTNGIQGGIVPTAVGMAFAEKYKKSGAVVAVFLGDGTLGEGVVYESFNLAALWQLPVLFVIEANGFAQSTPTPMELAGRIIDRPKAFGISTVEIQARDPLAIYLASATLIAQIRQTLQPACLILNTYRLGPHSKGDDIRTSAEIDQAKLIDPLNQMLNLYPKSYVKDLESRIKEQIDQTIALCETDSELSPEAFHQIAGIL